MTSLNQSEGKHSVWELETLQFPSGSKAGYSEVCFPSTAANQSVMCQQASTHQMGKLCG